MMTSTSIWFSSTNRRHSFEVANNQLVASAMALPHLHPDPFVGHIAIFLDEYGGCEFVQQHNASDAAVHTSLQSFASDPRVELVVDCSPESAPPERCRVSGEQ